MTAGPTSPTAGPTPPNAASTIVALVPDLMDRSKVSSVAAGRVTFVSRAEDLAAAVAALGTSAATLVVVDLARPGVIDALGDLAALHPRPTILGFGSHVDREQLTEARHAGADRVLARSAFFTDLTTYLA